MRGERNVSVAIFMVKDYSNSNDPNDLAISAQQNLLQISRMTFNDFPEFLHQAVELDAVTLKVSRISIWWLNETNSVMVCADAYERATKQHSNGMILQKDDYPKYFAALAQNRNIAATDARNDERTVEFTNGYMVPLDIFSMLDVPIRRNGRIVGVICHEQQIAPRTWSELEQSFATELAEMITAAMENAERRRAENALRESEVNLRRAQEITHLGCWSWNIREDQISWSEEMCHIYGVEPENVPRQVAEVNSFIHPEDRQHQQQAVELVIAGKNFDPYEYRIIRPDGEIRTVLIHGAEVERDAEGNPSRIFGTALDITEQKRTKEALLKSEERMRLFFERQIVGMAISDTDDHWLKFNDRLCQMFGYSRNEMSLKTWQHLIHPESLSIFLEKQRLLALGRINSYAIELRCLRSNGDSIYVIFSVGCVRTAKGVLDYILTLVEDITARKRAEQELAELNVAKDKFFSIIAHDLKSMFHGILGFSDLLKGELNTAPKETVEMYVDTINGAAHQTYNILSGLLEWANAQRGQIPFNPAQIPLSDLIEDESEVLQDNAARKNITITFDIPNQFTVFADRNMLKLILRNLLSNAVKFTPQNGIITLCATHAGQQAEIAVSDNGVGMSPQTIERLFKIDSAFSLSGTENEKGTGLGLLLCNEFVKKHGGKIWVESEPDKGSSFRFTLPEKHESEKSLTP